MMLGGYEATHVHTYVCTHVAIMSMYVYTHACTHVCRCPHGANGPPSGVAGPCDIYGAAGNPCVAAHSMTRALYHSYSDRLYSVKRSSDNSTKEIGVLAAGGPADSAAQDSFCGVAECVVHEIFDQSPMGNHLTIGNKTWPSPGGDKGVIANKSRVLIGGHPVYGAYFEGGMGYRNNNASGTATGDKSIGNNNTIPINVTYQWDFR